MWSRSLSERFTGVVLGGALAVLLGTACGRSALSVGAPDQLYAQAAQDHANGSYDAAITQYRQLLDHYPLDPRAEEVELRIAHAHLQNNAYPEAIAAFSDFQRMHPTSPHLPEVEYRISEAYVLQMDTIDRDLAAGRNAHDRLQSLLRRYPTSEFSGEARAKLTHVREHLASRELYIASFYFAHDRYEAGKVRVATILSQYPETRIAQESAERMADAARTAGDLETARLADAAVAEMASSPRPDLPPDPELDETDYSDVMLGWVGLGDDEMPKGSAPVAQAPEPDPVEDEESYTDVMLGWVGLGDDEMPKGTAPIAHAPEPHPVEDEESYTDVMLGWVGLGSDEKAEAPEATVAAAPEPVPVPPPAGIEAEDDESYTDVVLGWVGLGDDEEPKAPQPQLAETTLPPPTQPAVASDTETTGAAEVPIVDAAASSPPVEPAVEAQDAPIAVSPPPAVAAPQNDVLAVPPTAGDAVSALRARLAGPGTVENVQGTM
ncbi:MAG: outer membrane protein assembly factor BamD [Deltaproteobacteria bacterium]|nr:outer membrane protein assembly factor BamD [Deltaproteobacteria bacterium]